MIDKNFPSYGLWHVTTEGDCEGRTTKDLGVHQGNFDDIAFALAGQACYGLKFERVNPSEYTKHPPKTEVNVSLDIETGTWNMDAGQRCAYFRDLLKGRGVTVKESDYYACVTLVNGLTPADQKTARVAALVASARCKLSPDEAEALGLEGHKS